MKFNSSRMAVTILAAVVLLVARTVAQPAAPLPLLAHWAMEVNNGQIADAGPLKINAEANNISAVPGAVGQAAQFGPNSNVRISKPGLIDRAGAAVSATLWLKVDAYGDGGGLLVKREQNVAAPFDFTLGRNGELGFEGNNGEIWENLFSGPNAVPLGRWTQVGFSYQAGGEQLLFVDGKIVARKNVARALASNDQGLVIGRSPARGTLVGAIDEVKLYASALSPAQIALAATDAFPTRAAVEADFPAPTHLVNAALVRYDRPLGFQEGYGRTRQTAQRASGPDAVDWPNFTLGDKALWQDGAEQKLDVALRDGDQAKSLFQQPSDELVQPGNHWFRALQWLWGQRYVYTTDRTARTWHNDYELWSFPVIIQGAGDNDVRDVVLKVGNQTIYENKGPLRSLTLLLPQSEKGKPYQLSVAGRGPLNFEAGLQPIQVGDPAEKLRPVNLTVPGAGPKISVRNVERPREFPNPQQWQEDVQRMAALLPPVPPRDVLAQRRKNMLSNAADAVPLVANFAMEPDLKNPNALLDLGPLALNGQLEDGATYYGGGERDNALRLNGGSSRVVVPHRAVFDSLNSAMSFACWLRLDELPRADTVAYLVSTRPGWSTEKPWSIRLGPDGNWGFEGHDGEWKTIWADAKLTTGKWHHVAMTFKAGNELNFYLDGKAVKSVKAPNALTKSTQPLVFGYEEGGNFLGGARSGFSGLIDEAHIYAAALNEAQIKADKDGTLLVRAPAGFKAEAQVLAALQVLATLSKPSMTSALGATVPRSPLTINALALPHGMSGGAFFSGSDHMQKFVGNVDEFARYAASTGYDRIFERSSDPALITALNRNGVGYGLVPDTEWGRPFLTHSNVAFFSANLPDWHAPLYRDLQLQAQALKKFPNFQGFSIGADNGGYVSFWDWAPPIPNRPWGEAFMQFNGGKTSWPMPKHLGGQSTVREFLDYIARYDRTFEQYGYFADAISKVDPKLITTSGSFGSSPGVGARGGWPWATIPARPIFDQMPVQQAYDWNEVSSSKPLHLEALIDRLHSYYPEKTTWAIVDDFRLFLGREARQRAYALAAARGLDAIGTTFLAAPTGEEANVQKVAEQKELYDWMHKTGGAYAKTRPLAQIGVLYVHPQALLRRVNQDAGANDEALLNGSHEGKTTEALWMCHAAGKSARIITPEELKRGLPPEMSAILLTGLNRFDDSWVWYDGLEAALQKFVAGGGNLLLDNDSVAPPNLKATPTNMAIRAYITQNEVDQTPVLLARNRDNIAKLRALQVLAAPFVSSDDATIWAVPHQTGDVQYATVVNWGVEDGKNASQIVKPQIGALKWNTERPIYDVRAMKLLTKAEAARVDFSKDAAQLYALPPAPMSVPRVSLVPENDVMRATVMIGAGRGIAGVPVQITVNQGNESVNVYGASGAPIKLPIASTPSAQYQIKATELLSGLSATTTVKTSPAKIAAPVGNSKVAQFAAGKDKPLTIALTPEQAKDANLQALAKKLSAYFGKAGRSVKVGTIAPNDVVLSLQPLNPTRHFPQWKTIDSDLILLGSARDNLLIFDQQRGDLLSENAGLQVTHSPFVGEWDVLNILADNVTDLKAGVTQVVGF